MRGAGPGSRLHAIQPLGRGGAVVVGADVGATARRRSYVRRRRRRAVARPAARRPSRAATTIDAENGLASRPSVRIRTRPAWQAPAGLRSRTVLGVLGELLQRAGRGRRPRSRVTRRASWRSTAGSSRGRRRSRSAARPRRRARPYYTVATARRPEVAHPDASDRPCGGAATRRPSSITSTSSCRSTGTGGPTCAWRSWSVARTVSWPPSWRPLLRDALPDYEIVDDLDAIPVDLRGVHPGESREPLARRRCPARVAPSGARPSAPTGSATVPRASVVTARFSSTCWPASRSDWPRRRGGHRRWRAWPSSAGTTCSVPNSPSRRDAPTSRRWRGRRRDRRRARRRFVRRHAAPRAGRLCPAPPHRLHREHASAARARLRPRARDRVGGIVAPRTPGRHVHRSERLHRARRAGP